MSLPFFSEGWTETIALNLIASIAILVFQYIYGAIWSFRKRRNRDAKLSNRSGWLVLALPPVAIIGICAWQRLVDTEMLVLFALSLLPATIFTVKIANQLSALRGAGVHGVISEPSVKDYQKFLCNAYSGFSFLGVGAEKLTRDFEVFQAMVVRCGTPSRPVRLLLVSPDAAWLQEGASRRGLNKTTFQTKQIDSLQNIKRVKADFSGELEVRFYRTRPSLRLMFANDDICWLGHYTETVATPGANEYEQKSNSCVILKRPGDRAPDRQMYGALKGLFDEMWESAEEERWDFKTYLQ